MILEALTCRSYQTFTGVPDGALAMNRPHVLLAPIETTNLDQESKGR